MHPISAPATLDRKANSYLLRLGRTPGNYYLTFSRSETNEPEARGALGFNVAVPFREKPARFLGYPVIDGDTHDYRFLDPRPAVVALNPKGLALQDDTGFVREQCAVYGRCPHFAKAA